MKTILRTTAACMSFSRPSALHFGKIGGLNCSFSKRSLDHSENRVNNNRTHKFSEKSEYGYHSECFSGVMCSW